MGHRRSRRLRKFYWEQVAEIRKLLERLVKQESQIDIEKYLSVCEQLGQEPDPEKMPLTLEDFPFEVQMAFFVCAFLPDIWDGMSGAYRGKDWSIVSDLFTIYEIDHPKAVFFFAKMYEDVLTEHRLKELVKKQKTEEVKSRKNAGGGKQYTHNVRG